MWCRWGKTITTIAFGITASLASYEFASLAQIRNPAQSPSRTATPVQSSTPSQKSAASQIQSYTPSEIRAALKGLGYNVQQQGATLTDQGTRSAIRAFQRSYKLSAIDGVAGPNTQAVMATLVRNLHRNLNLVLKPSKPLPISQYYTPATATAVEQFQKQINFPTTGIATVSIRSKLDQEAKRVLGGSTSPGRSTTPTTSPSPTPTASPTTSPSPTASPTTSPSPEASPSVSPTIPEVSPSPTPTIPEVSPSPEASPSVSPTTPEVSPSPTPTTSP